MPRVQGKRDHRNMPGRLSESVPLGNVGGEFVQPLRNPTVLWSLLTEMSGRTKDKQWKSSSGCGQQEHRLDSYGVTSPVNRNRISVREGVRGLSVCGSNSSRFLVAVRELTDPNPICFNQASGEQSGP